MIIRPRPHWLRILFVWRGSVLPQILPQLLITTAFSLLVVVAHGQVLDWKITLNFVPFSLMGLALAIFLGFRNSTSYARFWEARSLWGTLLNDSRSALRQALTLLDGQADTRRFGALLMAFVHGVRHQLRGSDPTADLRRLLDDASSQRVLATEQRPSQLLLMASEWLRDRRRDGQIAPVLVPTIELSLSRLGDALGGCERIASTPIPFTYSVLMHRTIVLYCLLLPFGLLDAIGAMTPVIVAFMAYTFYALEAIGSEIEEPFGTAPNDLALDAMAQTIEHSLRELLGERPLPPSGTGDGVVLT